MDESGSRSKIRSHRDLIVWQKAMQLVVSMYKLSSGFPREELYGLTSQIRRAVVSVPSNIAEGQGRRLPKEYLQFLSHARGSLMEVDTQLELATLLNYIPQDEFEKIEDQLDEVGRLLNGLMRSIESSSHSSSI